MVPPLYINVLILQAKKMIGDHYDKYVLTRVLGSGKQILL